MSTTGNLLFPDDEDDGWIASIQKALPKEKNLDSLEIEDPVAIEAEAAFAEISAETATQETIQAAGWDAQEVASKTEPPPEAAPVESEYSSEALAALDSIIAREAPGPWREGLRVPPRGFRPPPCRASRQW